MKKIEEKKRICKDWFKSLRDEICSELEKIEDDKKSFKKKKLV